MKRKYFIYNGWTRQNEYGQSILTQITPRDFDPESCDQHQANAAQGFRTAPYRSVEGGFTFKTKAAFDDALKNLSDAGYAG